MALIVLRKDDLPLLQVLLEKCSDYLSFQNEEPVKPSAAHDLFETKPDGVEGNSKVLLGYIYRSETVGWCI